MVKTNFKCMYLVDDVLYKKVIRPESNLRRSDKIRSSTDYYDFKDQATSQNNPSLATSETSLPLPPSYTQMNTSNTEVPAIPSSNTHFKQLINAETILPPLLVSSPKSTPPHIWTLPVLKRLMVRERATVSVLNRPSQRV